MNTGIVFAQLKVNLTKIKTTQETKKINLFDSSDKVTKFLELTGNEFKELFYKKNTFSIPKLSVSKKILGDFCYLDQWCKSDDIGEIIKYPYFFDFKNEVILSWQKDIGINNCDWNYSNKKRLIKELNDINLWISNSKYEIESSLSYQELLSKLNCTKLIKGKLIKVSLLICNSTLNVKPIEIHLYFRIKTDETN